MTRPVSAVLILLISAVVIHVALAVFLFYLRDNPPVTYVPRSGVTPPAQVPEDPRLQLSPAFELRQHRERERQILSTYGWINRSRGVVRIPIEKAMEQEARRSR